MSNQKEYSSYLESIFQKSDDDGLILSSELKEIEIDIIYGFINKIYGYFKNAINQQHILEYEDGTTDEASEIETRKYYDKRIDAILRDKEIVEQWYKKNNIHIPGTTEAIKHNKMMDEMWEKVDAEVEKCKEKEAKTGVPILHKNDAFRILEKYEHEDYKPTTAEKNDIIKHPNFKKYTTQYTKNWKVQYPNVVKILIEKGSVSLKDFHSLCPCPNSDFFRTHLIESFKYECTNRKGRFYDNKKLRTLKVRKRRINGPNETEQVFII